MSQATAFAQATQPVADTTITTDTVGLIEGDIEIPTERDTVPGYYAAPATPGPHPIVLVVHEIFGVHEHIRDVVRRLAKSGYLAVAPGLFQRHGDISQLALIDEIREVVGRTPDEEVIADLDATLRWADQNGGDVERAAVTGFCWGGRVVWLYAEHEPRLRAAVAWYGRLTGAATPLHPRLPIDVAPTLSVPVLGLYGGADAGIPLDSVDAFREVLTDAGSVSTIHVYPDTPHAFYADYRPSFRRHPAEDGWARLRQWFAIHGV